MMRLINFIFLYILIPAAIVIFTIKSGQWYGFFGLVFYAAGLVISMFHQWIYFPLPLVFAFWWWYTYGLGPTDYVSIFTLCLLAGVLFSETSKQYHTFVHKVLPEQMDNVDYNEKVEEMHRRIEKFRKDHPTEKLTSEVVEKIRTDVFFH